MHRSHTLRVFMACLTVMWSVGCVDTAVEPKQETPVDPAIVANDALAQQIQKWIDRMDPYVSQLADGTFSIDYASFQQQYPNLTPEDQATVEGLRDGIPAQNEYVLTNGGGKGNSVESAACWTWWWGAKCCFSGNDAETAIYLVSIGAPFMPGGVVVMPIFIATLVYLKATSGGFCIYYYIFTRRFALTPLR